MAAKKKQAQKQKGKKGKGKGAATVGIAVANHPKASRQIAMLKSYAGLAAFAYAGYAAYQAGDQFADVAFRALIWGIAVYIAVWAAAVHVWRHVAIAEVRAAERRWKDQKAAQDEQVEKLRKVLEDNGMPTEGAGAMPVS
jgi:type VI protein secretion system component VasK